MELRDSLKWIASEMNDPCQPVVLQDNLLSFHSHPITTTQEQTSDVFSHKWENVKHNDESFQKSLERQKKWYLELYGFNSESELADYLKTCRVVLDAGAGKCGKAAWFASLAPETTVIAVDISTSVHTASEYYNDVDNLLFIQADIANMSFWEDEYFDYISCDQVIHHTSQPFETFKELVRLSRKGGEISVYVYRKKALPRELLDEYFRDFSQTLDKKQLMDLSENVTQLGRVLHEANLKLAFPDIPLLGITGGTMDLQRFIYWNFLKCFWNPELGEKTSTMCNFDWYAPSQAQRYSEKEFRSWITTTQLEEQHFHREEACYSGRFQKPLQKDEA